MPSPTPARDAAPPDHPQSSLQARPSTIAEKVQQQQPTRSEHQSQPYNASSSAPHPDQTHVPPRPASHPRLPTSANAFAPHDQQPDAHDVHRTSSISSADSGYLTSVPSNSADPSASHSNSNPLSFAPGPTRDYSATRQNPKTYPRVRLTNPKPRPQNETRQACIPCRKKKVGCDLRHPGNDYDPPCKRCVADGVRCVFSAGEGIPNRPGSNQLPSLSQLACPHCSLVFLKEDDLRIHTRTQCPEKQYVCPTCSSRFRRLNDLDRHIRIHTGERPHICDVCFRTFSRATTLTRHRQGPGGCAGVRADVGRRRLGSFQGPPPQMTPPEMLQNQPKSS